MNRAHLLLPLNCPTCGKPLRHIATKIEPEAMVLYICQDHGLFERSDLFERSNERFGEASTYFQSARKGGHVKFH
jgi:hypothetical protein